MSDEVASQERSPEATGPAAVDPQRLLRIASVTREVLEEARRIKPEPAAVAHLREVHAQITQELRESLPKELFEELDELTPDIRDGTLEELALAHAEILGWLEGLFQGTQLAIQVQAARAFQEQQRRLAGAPPGPEDRSGGEDGRYL
ncbi:MAG: bacterial proteasome activator family protein [Actinomycetota bacterium]|nr:bacterial proteasome activator family protein [Actinomycetota bacterium]